MEPGSEINIVCISFAIIRDLTELEISAETLPKMIGQLKENSCKVCIVSPSNRISDLALEVLKANKIDMADFYPNFDRADPLAYHKLAVEKGFAQARMYAVNYDPLDMMLATIAGIEAKQHIEHKNLGATSYWLRNHGLIRSFV